MIVRLVLVVYGLPLVAGSGRHGAGKHHGRGARQHKRVEAANPILSTAHGLGFKCTAGVIATGGECILSTLSSASPLSALSRCELQQRHSEQECLEICARSPDCNHVTIDRVGRRCIAYTRVRGTTRLFRHKREDKSWISCARRNSHWTRPPTLSTAKSSRFECVPENSYSGVLRYIGNTTLQACKHTCLGAPGCGALVHKQDGRCWLKETPAVTLSQGPDSHGTVTCALQEPVAQTPPGSSRRMRGLTADGENDVPARASEPSIDVVVAHRAEPLHWVGEELQRAPQQTRFLVYQHVDTEETVSRPAGLPRSAAVVRIPNRGLEAASFLQHIVSNYDSLADWTCFTQADRPTFGYGGLHEGGGHMMKGVKFADYLVVRPSGSFFMYTGAVVLPGLGQSSRSAYTQSTAVFERRTSHSACPSKNHWSPWWSIGWFEDALRGKLRKERGWNEQNNVGQAALRFYTDLVDPLHVPRDELTLTFSQGARFSVSRDVIRRLPKEHYERLLANVTVATSEWMWHALFLGVPQTCLGLPTYPGLMSQASAWETHRDSLKMLKKRGKMEAAHR